MKRSLSMLLAVGVLATGAVTATTPVAQAGQNTSVAATTTAGADAVAARHFTATGDLGRYYTKQSVEGIYRNHRGRPFSVTVYNWQGEALVFSQKPRLDPTWWGNYWNETYGLDQWYVGSTSGETFHLMLPAAPMGSTFTALLVTEFSFGGNWQNWMDGTST